jgi:hypothetical protein
MKKFLYTLIIFLNMQINCVLGQAPVNDINDTNDCSKTSIHCWPITYLSKGTLDCTAYSNLLNDNFNNLNNWNSYLEDINSQNARTHHPCEEQIYLDENVEIANNKCTLRGKYAPNTSYTWVNPNSPTDTKTFTRNFTSGAISTKSNYHFGTYEATIADMPGNGWWPAFWMWHHEEIDILERFSSSDKFAYNSFPNFKCKQSNSYEREPNGVSFFEGPHVFKVEWTPFKTIFFYNGQQLPVVIYKYYKFNGTPLDINCGDEIPEGLYRMNPNAIQSWRDGINGQNPFTEATVFRPIINLAVLPKYGFGACGPNTTVGCNTPPCSDWGNPVDDNGNERVGFEKNSNLTISNVLIRERKYKACGSIAVTYDPLVCLGKDFDVIVEDFENMNNNVFEQTHLVSVTSVSTSSNLSYLSQTYHKLKFKALSSGTGLFTINYKDECGTVRSVTRNITIKPSDECELDFCQTNITGTNCCPNNSEFDGANCLYKRVPNGYNPLISNGSFWVQPNNSISTLNNGCPLDYIFNGQNCYSGVDIPDGYEGFTGKAGFYLRPNCGDIRDCCPRGGFTFDGSNCVSSLSFPSGYSGFILENSFYVKPNCNISTNNECCPPGFTFDGFNCNSGVYIPSYTTGFILDNKFFVKPYCEDPKDCCPVGTKFDGANCVFGDSPVGSGKGFVRGNKFYVQPVGSTCPVGYSKDEFGCFSGITFPNQYEGFVFYSHEGTDAAFNTFYVKKKCPEEKSCCPSGAVHELISDKCWYRDVPKGYEPFIIGTNFYVRPNCNISTSNNCCPPGFIFDSANCVLKEGPSSNTQGLVIENGGFYSLKDCTRGLVGGEPIDEREENGNSEVEIPDLKITPNPTSGEINLEINFGDLEPITVFLIDINGNRLEELRINNVENRITSKFYLDNYPSGIYYFLVSNSTKQKAIRLVKI